MENQLSRSFHICFLPVRGQKEKVINFFVCLAKFFFFLSESVSPSDILILSKEFPVLFVKAVFGSCAWRHNLGWKRKTVLNVFGAINPFIPKLVQGVEFLCLVQESQDLCENVRTYVAQLERGRFSVKKNRKDETGVKTHRTTCHSLQK